MHPNNSYLTLTFNITCFSSAEVKENKPETRLNKTQFPPFVMDET